MKAITHNILMCHTKKCAGSDNNYPLIIKPSNIKETQVEFDEEFTKIWFDRQDKRGLNQFCKDLGIVKFDLTNIDDKLKQDNQFLNYIHHVLNEIIVEEGTLVCPNCGREYPINKGIINYNLNDDEL